jgi:hypothetical protein
VSTPLHFLQAWRKRYLDKPFLKAIVVSCIGSIIPGIVIGMFIQPRVVHWLHDLPPEIYDSIKEEADWAKKRDCGKYASLFTEEGRIADRRNDVFWDGTKSITKRCTDLPRFTSLEHIPMGDPTMPAHGYPVVKTKSVLAFVNKNNEIEQHDGYENWEFTKNADGKWKIVEFEFNLQSEGR